MACIRSHQLPNGKCWSTLGDGTAYIMVPLDQIGDMTAAEIGAAVRSLTEQAKATALLNWIDCGDDLLLNPYRRIITPQDKCRRLCAALGSDAQGWQRDDISLHWEQFKEMEELQHLDSELESAYKELCHLLDESLKYLLTKKSKLTPGQTRARRIILEMRHGCELCGLVEGRHSANCRKISRTIQSQNEKASWR
jgi:hypothetical protein